MELPIQVIPAENKPLDKRMDQLNHPYLPKLPANLMILGQCGSGKSSILYSLLSDGYTYGKKKKSIFDEGIVYLGTQDAVEAFHKLPIKNHIVLHDFDPDDFEEYLDDLKKHQMEKLSRGKPPMNTILIFDDFVGQNLMKHNKGKASPLERLALTSRHEANASLVFCSQVYRNSGFAHPVVRNNITTYILAQMSRPEISKIADELSGDFTPDEFIAIYDKIMAKRRYNFMVYDTRRPLDMRWTERFNTPIVKPKRLLDLYRNGQASEKRNDNGSGEDTE
jgi:GTPase SAR1 family protein